jgi:acetyl-CoA/propionyl-CoA carboxylase biotin carboxyl carrier protein
MGGTVVRWLVEPGEQVDQGHAVVLLEAMKTETRLVAHRAGAVEPKVAAGEHVDTGATLALIEG